MSIQIVYNVLSVDSAVIALVGTRITPVERKDYIYPAVVLTEYELDAVNALDGWGGTDHSVIQVDSWGTTFSQADAVAAACRTALQNAGHLLQPSSTHNFDPLAQLGGVFRVSNQFSIWN